MTDRGVEPETSAELAESGAVDGAFVPSSRVAGPMTSQKLVFSVLSSEWHLDNLYVDAHGSGGVRVTVHDWLPAEVVGLLHRFGLPAIPVDVRERCLNDESYVVTDYELGDEHEGGLKVVWFLSRHCLLEGKPYPLDPPF